MRRATVVSSSIACATVVVFAAFVVAQDDQQPSQGLPFDVSAMEKIWEAYAAPGPEHERLAEMVGTWKTVSKHYMENPAEPDVYEGTAKFQPHMDGRFVMQRFESEFDGKPFHGFGIDGYDNAKKKYVSVWFDNMGTGFMIQEGEYDEASGSITQTGVLSSPLGEMKVRTVFKRISKDEQHFTMYMTMPGAPEMKSMDVTYTRI